MVRTPCCDRSGQKKGSWTPEEDRKLIAYVTRYGCWNWRQLPKFAGLARCGKSCRLRWLNYLRPNIKRGNYTPEEEETIIKLHQQLGNRWSAIAAALPGRTDNDIKNYWHTNLKKRFQHKSATHEEMAKVESRQEIIDSVPMPNKDTCPLSSPHSYSSSEFSCMSSTTAASNDKLIVEDEFAFLDAYCTETEAEGMSGNFWTEPYMADISYVPNEPFLVTEPGYFSPVCEAPLWSQNLYDEYTTLF